MTDSNDASENNSESVYVKSEQTVDYSDFETVFWSVSSQINDLRVSLEAEEITYNDYKAEVMVAVNSLVRESENIVSQYNFSTEELNEIYGDLNQSEMAMVDVKMASIGFLMAINIDDDFSDGPTNVTMSEPWSGSRIGPCVLEALGAEALVDLYKGRAMSSFAVRRAIIKGVGKVAARIGLGAIGTALAVADFVWCMGRE